MIDATPPRIELDAAAGGTGDVKAAWRISDDTLDPPSLRIEYQASDVLQSPWQTVKLEPEQQQATGNVLTGEVKFLPSASNRTVDIRLVARDRAGNVQSEVRRVTLPRVAQATPPAAAWPSPMLAKSNSSPPNMANDPFTSRMPATPPVVGPPVANPTLANTTPIAPTAEAWPVDNALPTTLAAKPSTESLSKTPLARAVGEVAPRVRDGVPSQQIGSGSASPLLWPSEAAKERESPPNNPANTLPADSGTPPSVPQKSSLPLDPRSEIMPKGKPAETRDLAPIPNSNLPIDVKPLLSPSKSFSLDYDLDSVGPAGVKAVELWVTTDSGHTWRKWGEDADKQSPFEIQVESERTFGFRMVIVANNGLATHPPEPGDAADVWVQIDTTQPTVRIMQAGYGQGEHAGQLDLRWQADDEHLGSRPVTIVFSEQPEGPYTTLAAGLPNTGQYYWTIDPRTPRQLYLRIEVRDEAGNLGVAQTTEPVSLEGLAPRGRIRSVAPTQPANIRGAFKTPLFR